MQVKLHEAKTHLSRLIQRVLEGEEVIIAKGARPLVRLVALDTATDKRQLGSALGQVKMSDDFDAQLEDFDGYQ